MTARREVALEAGALEDQLGDGWAVALAQAPLDERQLTRGEAAVFARLPAAGPRRGEWLTGRAALRALLVRLGADRDTARIRMPHATVSLTHSGSTALAVAATSPATDGVGVDLEPVRPVPHEAARFFLRSGELAGLLARSCPALGLDVLRLWTIKEAVFKADAANAPRQLRDYRVDDVRSWSGRAVPAGHPTVGFRYRTVQAGGHLLSVARRTET